MMHECNKELVKEMIEMVMKDEKKCKVLENALYRNFDFTSDYNLPYCTLEIYKEGWYLILGGCKCSFKVWFDDNDGELIINRKPNKDKISLIYTEDCNTYNVYEF